jgi:CoA:oxalate CoA-transferase
VSSNESSGEESTAVGALDGIRVLDLSTLVQGPQAGAMLFNLGAEVINIELPDVGDLSRHIENMPEYGHSAVFIANNRGKQSVSLDLRVDAGRRAFLALVAKSDVVLSNFKPGTLEEWGLGYDDLAAVNPAIIDAQASYMGHQGPDSHREGADMVGQAAGGIVSTSGFDGGPVSPVGTLVADHSGSQNLQTGILAALFARHRTGRGQRVEVSLLGGQIWMQANEYTHLGMTGEMVSRTNGGYPLVNALYGTFSTSDGALAIAGCPEHLWPGMVRAVERPDLHDNPRFGTYFSTPAIKAELFEVFGEIFASRTTAEWCERLAVEEQRFSAVRSHQDVLDDPQSYANGYLFKGEHPDWGEKVFVGSPIVMSDTPTRSSMVPPELGQDTEMTLVEIGGFDWDEVEQLRADGAF